MRVGKRETGFSLSLSLSRLPFVFFALGLSRACCSPRPSSSSSEETTAPHSATREALQIFFFLIKKESRRGTHFLCVLFQEKRSSLIICGFLK